MANFVKEIFKNVNMRTYDLYLNDKKIDLFAKRIKNAKDYYHVLMSNRAIVNEESVFFVYNESIFASFGLSENLDIVFVNWDGMVTNIEENFPTNKISEEVKKTKFIYLFSKGVIKSKKIVVNDILKHEYNRKNKTNKKINLTKFI